MMEPTSRPVVVGIDGSQAAIAAALWATDEAIGRAVPLRLVSVIKPKHASPEDYARDFAHAEESLHAARVAVHAHRDLVKIETDIPRGPAGPVLLEASQDAALVCVGSVGIGRYARSLLGSTATELAEHARCPVAVIRTDSDQPPPEINWIIVRMTDGPDSASVVQQAMWEATLRRAPLLLLGGHPEDLSDDVDGEFERRAQQWRRNYPQIRVYPIATRNAIASFLSANDERVGLAVIGADEAGQLASLIGPQGHPLFGHPECSVLVVR